MAKAIETNIQGKLGGEQNAVRSGEKGAVKSNSGGKIRKEILEIFENRNPTPGDPTDHIGEGTLGAKPDLSLTTSAEKAHDHVPKLATQLGTSTRVEGRTHPEDGPQSLLEDPSADLGIKMHSRSGTRAKRGVDQARQADVDFPSSYRSAPVLHGQGNNGESDDGEERQNKSQEYRVSKISDHRGELWEQAEFKVHWAGVKGRGATQYLAWDEVKDLEAIQKYGQAMGKESPLESEESSVNTRSLGDIGVDTWTAEAIEARNWGSMDRYLPNDGVTNTSLALSSVSGMSSEAAMREITREIDFRGGQATEDRGTEVHRTMMGGEDSLGTRGRLLEEVRGLRGRMDRLEVHQGKTELEIRRIDVETRSMKEAMEMREMRETELERQRMREKKKWDEWGREQEDKIQENCKILSHSVAERNQEWESRQQEAIRDQGGAMMKLTEERSLQQSSLLELKLTERMMNETSGIEGRMQEFMKREMGREFRAGWKDVSCSVEDVKTEVKMVSAAVATEITTNFTVTHKEEMLRELEGLRRQVRSEGRSRELAVNSLRKEMEDAQ